MESSCCARNDPHQIILLLDLLAVMNECHIWMREGKCEVFGLITQAPWPIVTWFGQVAFESCPIQIEQFVVRFG